MRDLKLTTTIIILLASMSLQALAQVDITSVGTGGVLSPDRQSAPKDSIRLDSIPDPQVFRKYGGYSPDYLDTVQVKKTFSINDYSLVGVEYGASLSRMSFNPPRLQTNLFAPNTFGIYITRYGKMFNYLPYFGFKAGIRYGHEGYKFKENKETKVMSDIEGATQALMEVVELPFMAHLHLDLLHFKLMADVGIYGGYRLSIDRIGEAVAEDIRRSFLETDNRWDYGLSAGLGFGLVFDPLEFHVNAGLRYSWATIYKPDHFHKDYYRYAYPLDLMLSAGLYFQLTKRTGKTKPQIRKEAYDQVYNPSPVGALVPAESSNESSNGKSDSESR